MHVVVHCTQKQELHVGDISISTTHLTLNFYIQLPGHIPRSLGTAATPEITLQLHIPETMYQLPHKMADQE